MRKKLIFYAILSLALAGSFLVLCNKKQPIEPEIPCINDQPVEDTTRVYIHPTNGSTMEIYPKAVYARFYPWVKDTSKIMQLIQKHHLRLYSFVGIADQISAKLCVTDARRAEYHFTPYGKENFCNFGADSLVEYAFGVFGRGYVYPNGTMAIKFEEGTSQTRIDSLFNANGLRLLFIYPDLLTGGKSYKTLVTPKSTKNVIDLCYEIKSLPFIDWVIFGLATGGRGINCDD